MQGRSREIDEEGSVIFVSLKVVSRHESFNSFSDVSRLSLEHDYLRYDCLYQVIGFQGLASLHDSNYHCI